MKNTAPILRRQSHTDHKIEKSTGIMAISFVFYQCFFQQKAWAKSSIDKLHPQNGGEAIQANNELDSTNDISNTLSDTEISQLIANMESSTVNTERNDINNLTDLFTKDDAIANLFDNNEWLTHNDTLQAKPHSSFQEGAAPDLQAITKSPDTLLEFNAENDVENAGTLFKTASTFTKTTIATGTAETAVAATGGTVAGAGAGTYLLAAAGAAAAGVSIAKGDGKSTGITTGDGSMIYLSDLSGDVLMLEERDLSGSFHVTSAGGIKQSVGGQQIVKGNSTFITNTDGKTITLENAPNAFAGDVDVTTLTVGSTVAKVILKGDGSSVTNAVTFENDDTIQLGDQTGVTLTFSGGLTATAPGQVIIGGGVLQTASNNNITLGDGNANAVSVTADATLKAGTGNVVLKATAIADGQVLTIGQSGVNPGNIDFVALTIGSGSSVKIWHGMEKAIPVAMLMSE